MKPCCEAKVQQLYKTIEQKEEQCSLYKDKLKFQEERLKHLNETIRKHQYDFTLCGLDKFNIHDMKNELHSLREKLKESPKIETLRKFALATFILSVLNVIQFFT